MKLYSYFRSSAAYRVRIALQLKGLAYDYVPVHLGRGEQLQDSYAQINTERLVPLLELDNGRRLSQSLAIIEYLEEQHPEPALLPSDALGRARVRALAQMVACDIHPLNNLRVLKYLVHDLKLDEAAKLAWYRHWIALGLQAVETQLREHAQGLYCLGDQPGLADCFLVPQIFNAQRFDCKLQGLTRSMAVFEACMCLPAFERAHPAQCPDHQA